MSDEKKSEYPMEDPAYPPVQGGYPTQQGGYPTQPAGGAPPPYYQPPVGQPGYPPQQPAHVPQPQPGYPPQQGYAPTPQAPGQTVIIRQTQMQPNDYLAFAIFVTICCCLPFGIVGIIKATEVRSRYASGDYQGAEDSSKSAKNWSCAGLVTGCIVIGGFFIFYVLIYLIILGAALSGDYGSGY